MFGKEECVPCLVLLSVWAKPWEPLCLLDFLQEVNTLCLPAHFAFLHCDLELQYLGNKWWVPQPIFLNIQMMSHQLLVWFGDVDGWPHEGHDTESSSTLPSPFSLGVWHSAIVSDTISVFRTSDRMQDLVHGCNHYSNCTHASLLIPNFLFHYAWILLEVNSTKVFHGHNCQKV